MLNDMKFGCYGVDNVGMFRREEFVGMTSLKGKKKRGVVEDSPLFPFMFMKLTKVCFRVSWLDWTVFLCGSYPMPGSASPWSEKGG